MVFMLDWRLGLTVYGLCQTSNFSWDEFRSWKVRRLAQFISSEWIWIVQHVLSVCFRRKECLRSSVGTNVDLHMRPTKLIIKNSYDNVYLASFGRLWFSWLSRRVLSSSSEVWFVSWKVRCLAWALGCFPNVRTGQPDRSRKMKY